MLTEKELAFAGNRGASVEKSYTGLESSFSFLANRLKESEFPGRAWMLLRTIARIRVA
ncbi:MAG: hypothetical protein GTO67_17165 [Gammaproteobacteria bacterium]|nr:hypothetical protein [Gammaproteobacteria bacterium]NIO25415.1 hypothetical protein [Gammaproteobacteria bacterium]NIO66093.1 hypothetical protein [Gammaproteobacteria bacterium]NIP64936.1 hypothetical protein [Gammaproteobacteria bacterium]NIQ27209.1 hypothetical protein [Gammaproteobacteria bacterium]